MGIVRNSYKERNKGWLIKRIGIIILPRYNVCKECCEVIINLLTFMNSCSKCGSTSHERSTLLEREALEKQKEILTKIRNNKIDKLLGED